MVKSANGIQSEAVSATYDSYSKAGNKKEGPYLQCQTQMMKKKLARGKGLRTCHKSEENKVFSKSSQGVIVPCGEETPCMLNELDYSLNIYTYQSQSWSKDGETLRLRMILNVLCTICLPITVLILGCNQSYKELHL